MGQYHIICNLDKKQYLNPSTFEDGRKLKEFGSSGMGTMYALSVLLSESNNRGGGDFHTEHPLVGSWAGDRITITGDYASSKDPVSSNFISDYGGNLMEVAEDSFEDISSEVLEILQQEKQGWG